MFTCGLFSNTYVQFFLIFDIFVKKEKKKWLMKVFGPLKFSFVAHART